jgi:hypothetical protein
MSASDALELSLLNRAFGQTVYTPDPIHYIGLSGADPGETGATNNEPSGGSYGRVAVTNNTTTWPSGNPKLNGIVVTFNTPSANWLGGANITWFTVWNDATLSAPANFIGAGQLANPQPAMTGNLVRFQISALAISMT